MTTRLAILPNWLGDLVMASPALRHWGTGARLVGVGAPPLVELSSDLGLIDAGVVYDRRGADRSPRRWPDVARRLRAVGAGEALVLGPSLRAAVLGAVSGARTRRGLGGEGREVFLTDVHRVAGGARNEHLSKSWWHAAGATGEPPRPHWSTGPRAATGITNLRREFPALDGDFAVYAAGATYGPTKRWPAAGFADVARAVNAARGWTPVFVGSSAPREIDAARALAETTGGHALAGATDLPTLVAMLERARLFVGNDSGPMHVAAAVGTPTVGIFGSTSPTWTAPRGVRAVVVGPADVSCSPCFRRTCPFDLECLRDLSSAHVLEAVDACLDAGTEAPEVRS